MSKFTQEFQGAELLDWQDGAPVVRCVGHSFTDPMRVDRIVANGDDNTKTRKRDESIGRHGKAQSHLSCGVSLSPHKLAGIGNNCAGASPACIEACLNETGLGSVFPRISAARIAKSFLFHTERDWFLNQLSSDLERWSKKAERAELGLCCRLNMLSDIPWEHYGVIEQFPQIQFYDYSKVSKRFDILEPNQIRDNYFVVFSRSETNESEALEILGNGGNVAVVFHNRGKFTGNRAGKQTLPKTWNGYRVHDGDTDDRRFLDPRGRKHGVVIGLRLKSPNNDQRQSAIESGFSVEVSQ